MLSDPDHVPGTLRRAPIWSVGASVEVCYHVSAVHHLVSTMWEPGRIVASENGLFGAVYTVEVIRARNVVDSVRISCWSHDIRSAVRSSVAPAFSW